MKFKLLLLVFILLWGLTASGATVSGFVREHASLESLYGCNVFLADTQFGTMTNIEGYYTITSIPPGEYKVYYSYIGYDTMEESVNITSATDDIVINVEMKEKPIEMTAIDVVGDRVEEIRPGLLKVSAPAIKKVPEVVDSDLFRAIQFMPGVSTASDFSSGLYVRGGSPDQNLILLDDIDVYNPTHMFGFFSTFNVDAVKSVDLQKGGFPARFGGRLSSVLDVHNRDGNRKEFEGIARITALSASTTLEGPWAKGSWMLSGRRSYLDKSAKALIDEEIPYHFYDLHGKINYDISNNDLTSLSFYSGRDILDWDMESIKMYINWGNDTFSSQWTHLFNSRLYSRFILAGSQYQSETKFTFLGDFSAAMINEISDLSLKGILSYNLSSAHNVDFGFDTKMLDFALKRRFGDSRFDLEWDGVYGGMYLQSHYSLGALWQLQSGLRLNYYSQGDHIDLAPRISLKRQLTKEVSVHATYGKYFQYLNLIQEEGFSAGDMWFPVDETIDPGRAHQYILGLQYEPNNNFSLEAEVYYKDYDNLIELDEEYVNSGEMDDSNKSADIYVNTGIGEAYGFDVYLKNYIGGLEGWMGYTYGHTKRKIEDYNFDKEYYPNYDKRHQITVIEDYYLGKGFKLNAAFKYSTGGPMTRATARYVTQDINGNVYDVVLEGEKNKYRVPDYHRLDIGIHYEKDFKNWSIEPYIQVINVYNRDNVYQRFYNADDNPATYEDVTMLPRFPSGGIIFKF